MTDTNPPTPNQGEPSLRALILDNGHTVDWHINDIADYLKLEGKTAELMEYQVRSLLERIQPFITAQVQEAYERGKNDGHAAQHAKDLDEMEPEAEARGRQALADKILQLPEMQPETKGDWQSPNLGVRRRDDIRAAVRAALQDTTGEGR